MLIYLNYLITTLIMEALKAGIEGNQELYEELLKTVVL